MPERENRTVEPVGPRAAVPVVDSQVHAWLRPCDRYPWAPGLLEQLPPELRVRYTARDRPVDELVEMMAGIGVARAVLVSPWLYGDDHTYVLDAAERFPEQVVVVAPYELPLPDATAALAALRRHPGALGPRIFLGSPSRADAPVEAPAVDAVLVAASELGLPVFISPMGRLAEVARIARAHPEVTLVLDHAGLWLPAPLDERWALLPAVLELAGHPNVLVKCSALPELSSTDYPYPDLWRILHPLLERFGAHRLMWGSDINQHRDRLSYAQSLDYIRESPRLADADRAQLLGGTATRLIEGHRAAVARGAAPGGP